jgi:hypothetical protein
MLNLMIKYVNWCEECCSYKKIKCDLFSIQWLWTGGNFRHSGGPNHSIQVPKLRLCGALLPMPL